MSAARKSSTTTCWYRFNIDDLCGFYVELRAQAGPAPQQRGLKSVQAFDLSPGQIPRCYLIELLSMLMCLILREPFQVKCATKKNRAISYRGVAPSNRNEAVGVVKRTRFSTKLSRKRATIFGFRGSCMIASRFGGRRACCACSC